MSDLHSTVFVGEKKKKVMKKKEALNGKLK